MRQLFKILLFILLFCSIQNNAVAGLKTYSLLNNQIKPDKLAHTLNSGGFILELKENEIFTHQNFEILATANSHIYISGKDQVFTAALVGGAVKSNKNRTAKIGEIFIYNKSTNITTVENFDVKYFLNRNRDTLPLNLIEQLTITSKKQSTKKALGLFENDKNKRITSKSALNNIISSLKDQDISNVVINEQTMDLSQFETFVIEQNLPIHILVSWGSSVTDLDIHLTGPQGSGRFHIFYLSTGDLENAPHAAIIDDCISTNCSEVIRINDLNKNGVYRASVYNFGDQDKNSDSLSSSNVEIEVIRGGTYVPTDGDTDAGNLVSGGQSIFKGSPTAGEVGNTWQAIEINSNSGDINFINKITNFENSRDVQ